MIDPLLPIPTWIQSAIGMVLLWVCILLMTRSDKL